MDGGLRSADSRWQSTDGGWHGSGDQTSHYGTVPTHTAKLEVGACWAARTGQTIQVTAAWAAIRDGDSECPPKTIPRLCFFSGFVGIRVGSLRVSRRMGWCQSVRPDLCEAAWTAIGSRKTATGPATGNHVGTGIEKPEKQEKATNGRGKPAEIRGKQGEMGSLMAP